MVINTYGAECDSDTYYLNRQSGFPVMTLYYSGAGTPTYDFTGGNDAGGNTVWNFLLKINGATVYTIPITDITGAGPLWVDEFVAYINTNCVNWHAAQTSGTNGDYIGARYLQSGTAVAVSTSSGSPTVLKNSFNMHTEWASMQGVPYNTTNSENVLHAYNTTAPSVCWDTGWHPFWWMSDAFLINNAFIAGTNAYSSPFPAGGNSGIVANADNVVVMNCDWDGGIGINALTPSTVSFALNNVEYWLGSSGLDPAYPSVMNSLISLGQNNMLNGPHSSGNLQLGTGGNSAAYQATYTNKAAGNYKPAGLKLTNLFAQAFPYDRNYNPRNMSSDAAGSSAIGFAEPSRPY